MLGYYSGPEEGERRVGARYCRDLEEVHQVPLKGSSKAMYRSGHLQVPSPVIQGKSTVDKLLAPLAPSKCPSSLGPRGSPTNQRASLRLVGAKHATPAFYRDFIPRGHHLALITMLAPLLLPLSGMETCIFLPLFDSPIYPPCLDLDSHLLQPCLVN